MSLTKKDRVLLIKLFYQNGGNLSIALPEYRRLNCLRKGSMSKQALKKMVQNFKEIEDLSVMRGRRRKRISNEILEVAYAVVESESGSRCSASSNRAV